MLGAPCLQDIPVYLVVQYDGVVGEITKKLHHWSDAIPEF